MTGTSKRFDRFAGAFLEELGRWTARLVIAAMIVFASGFLILPS